MGFGKQRGFSGQGRGKGVYVTFQNVDLVKSILDEIEDGLKRDTNKELRQAAKEIARDVVIPHMKTAAASDTKLAVRMAETARPKADRVVMVQVGGVTPQLSGFKKGRGVSNAKPGSGHYTRQRSSRNYAATLAWGSEFGPYPGAAVNHYGFSRRSVGWVQRGMQASIPQAVARYNKYLNMLIDSRSKYR